MGGLSSGDASSGGTPVALVSAPDAQNLEAAGARAIASKEGGDLQAIKMRTIYIFGGSGPF